MKDKSKEEEVEVVVDKEVMLFYKNKKIISDEAGAITVEGGEIFTPTELEREVYISDNNKTVLQNSKVKILRAVFEDVLEIYRKQNLTLADMDMYRAYEQKWIEELQQRVLAVRLVGVRKEDYAPGYDYEKEVTVDKLATWNEEITDQK